MSDRSDDTQSFETLGVDQIYVDEADRYKNLPYVTNMGSARGGVKGLPQSESQRAWDMYMKIRYLQDKQGQKPDGVVRQRWRRLCHWHAGRQYHR